MTRCPFASSAPHFNLLRQRIGLSTGWGNNGLHGHNHLPDAVLTPGCDDLAQQLRITVQMGGKDKMPVEGGRQQRAFCAGAQQKPRAGTGGSGVARTSSSAD